MLMQKRRKRLVSLSLSLCLSLSLFDCIRWNIYENLLRSSNYLMNCSLADSEPLYISQGSLSTSDPAFNFQQKCARWTCRLKISTGNLAGPSRHFCKDGAVCAKPARTDLQSGKLLRRGPALLRICSCCWCCCQSSADCCRGRRTQLLSVTEVFWVNVAVVLLFERQKGMLGIMLDDRRQQWTLVTTSTISLSQLRQRCLQRVKDRVALLTNCMTAY